MKRNSKAKTLNIFVEKAMKLFGTAKITREQAKESGLTFYWSGEPCGKGHLTFRYTKSCDCRQCASDGNFDRNHPELAVPSEEVQSRKALENLKYEFELKKLEKEDYDYDL